MGATYTLTGPEVLTQCRQAEVIGGVIGREVRFVEQSVAEYRRTADWAPPEIVESVLRHRAEAVDAPAICTDTVQEVTGHPARSFAEWVTGHAADFR